VLFSVPLPPSALITSATLLPSKAFLFHSAACASLIRPVAAISDRTAVTRSTSRRLEFMFLLSGYSVPVGR
jgi:hypothetical protein